jgi:hypothetical protein
MNRRAPRRDANEALILDAFKAAGCAVLSISAEGGPDAIVFHHARFWLVEVKGKKGTLTAKQARFHQAWRGPEIYIVRTVERALELAKG